MEQQRPQVVYQMPDFLLKYNPIEMTEEDLAPIYPKKKKLTEEQKRQRMLDAKRDMFAKYHKKFGSDFYDN